MAEGIDYSYGSGLSANAMKSAGKHFACRYLATLPNSKCINRAEATNLLHAGLSVVLVWETVADRVLSGHNGGVPAAPEPARQPPAWACGASRSTSPVTSTLRPASRPRSTPTVTAR